MAMLGKKRSGSSSATTLAAVPSGREGFVELEDQTTATPSGSRGDGSSSRAGAKAPAAVVGYNVSAWGTTKDEEAEVASGGAAAAAEAGVKVLPMMTEVPEGRIRVDSEVEVVSCERGGWLEYNDRLY